MTAAPSLRSEVIQKWWPTTQSLDLVEGSTRDVAAALETELRRFLAGEPVAGDWKHGLTLDQAFREADDFANVPTVFLVLPTRSRWSVLWNNSFLSNGYDSLCHCLTLRHGLTSVHWSAHDVTTTFQAGATFCHRRLAAGAVHERTVAIAREDARWSFFQSGEPLPEEAVEDYSARRVRDRLDEHGMTRLLGRLGAHPWQDDFYALGEQPVFVARRTHPPATVSRKSRDRVLGMV